MPYFCGRAIFFFHSHTYFNGYNFNRYKLYTNTINVEAAAGLNGRQRGEGRILITRRWFFKWKCEVTRSTDSHVQQSKAAYSYTHTYTQNTHKHTHTGSCHCIVHVFQCEGSADILIYISRYDSDFGVCV